MRRLPAARRALAVGTCRRPADALRRRVCQARTLLGVRASASADEIIEAHRRLIARGPSRPRRQRASRSTRPMPRATCCSARACPTRNPGARLAMSHTSSTPPSCANTTSAGSSARRWAGRRARDRPRLRARCCAAPAASGWRSAMTGGSARRCSSTRWSRGSTPAACDVVRLGMGPTPMLYYAEASAEDVDGGIQITGSHNPANYNGFKMVFQGRPFFGEDITELGRMAAAGDWVDGTGTSETPRCHGRLHRPAARRARRDRPRRAGRSSNRLGRGQRRRRPRARGADRPAAGRALICSSPKSTGIFPTIILILPRRRTSPICERWSRRRTSISEWLSTAMATGSARSTAQGRIIWGDQLLMIYAEDLLRMVPGRHDYRRCEGQPRAVRAGRRSSAASR